MNSLSTDVYKLFNEASVKTADNLRSIAQSKELRDLSSLSLPEIEAVIDLVAQVIPAGNVPGVILNGLVRLTGRRPPLDDVRRDVNLLFRGIKQTLDRAVYTACFTGPAAVIWGYQNLLKLAGKNPDEAFPEGVWQFYTEYALREDSARHANETHGFDTALRQHGLELSEVDRLTAWVMAAITCLHSYDELLRNEWRERVYTRLLAQVTTGEPDAAVYARLYQEWARQRPYRRGQDSEPQETYPLYRRLKFDRFLEQAMAGLRADLRLAWLERVRQAREQELPAYQRQMSILAYLEPGPYDETKVTIPLAQARIGLIHQGCYFLIPASFPGTARPAEVNTVRAQITSLVHHPPRRPPAQLARIVQIKREAWADLRPEMSRTLVAELDTLRQAPILLNADQRPAHLPLAEIRQAERGAGDHALTLFDTGETMVFDQSHIFFDGAWGAALAEIMTNEALSWAVYLHQLPPARPQKIPITALTCHLQPGDLSRFAATPGITPEVSVETDAVDLPAILALRKLFKQRNDLLELTVNDLLVLYRAIHAASYEPDPKLLATLKELAGLERTFTAAAAALSALDRTQQANPTVVIPVDASQHSPRDRLYPMTFEVPLEELDLLDLSRQVAETLDAYHQAEKEQATLLYDKFDQLQRVYLATLAGFGQVSSKAKQIAMTGESSSVGFIKLLAHIPPPLQRLLDRYSGRFDLLNDFIKGREVFSNVGAVAPTSTLTRFITAKDDNDKKTLAWGILTDAQGVMRITLRDFRPHVGLLVAAGRRDLALGMAEDYLKAYAHGLNRFIRDLQRITRTSRETPSSEKTETL